MPFKSDQIKIRWRRGSYLASRVWSRADGGRSLFGVRAAKAGRKQRTEEATETLPEDAVGEAVDETVTEAVADGQPCGEKRRCWVVIDPSTFQQKVEDVGQPEDIKHAGNAEQYHSITFVWVC